VWPFKLIVGSQSIVVPAPAVLEIRTDHLAAVRPRARSGRAPSVPVRVCTWSGRTRSCSRSSELKKGGQSKMKGRGRTSLPLPLRCGSHGLAAPTGGSPSVPLVRRRACAGVDVLEYHGQVQKTKEEIEKKRGGVPGALPDSLGSSHGPACSWCARSGGPCWNTRVSDRKRTK